MGERGMLPGDPRAKEAGAKAGKAIAPAPPANPLAMGEIPPAPKGISRRTRTLWVALWQSSLASALDWQVDRFALIRWARLIDRWYQIERQLEKADTVVTGSQGQDVLNPLSSELHRLDGMVAKVEKELGLTPMSRARLGLTQLEGALTAAQLNAMISSDPLPDGGDPGVVDITIYEEGTPDGDSEEQDDEGD